MTSGLIFMAWRILFIDLRLWSKINYGRRNSWRACTNQNSSKVWHIFPCLFFWNLFALYWLVQYYYKNWQWYIWSTNAMEWYLAVRMNIHMQF